MTGTCTLCGEVITAEPDGLLDSQRDDRTMGRFGGIFRSHMEKRHGQDQQTVLYPPLLQGGTIPQLIGITGITSQSVVMFSYLISIDPVFLLKLGQMRQIVSKAMEQKESKPVVTVS